MGDSEPLYLHEEIDLGESEPALYDWQAENIYDQPRDPENNVISFPATRLDERD